MRADSGLVKRFLEECDRVYPLCKGVKDEIGLNPELGSEEERASALLAGALRDAGFQVEYPFHGMHTAFKAVYRAGVGGGVVAFLAEYDALPRVGHGCGHNIIAACSLGAGLALSRVMEEVGGEVWVVGTPAEEGHGPYGGAKVSMAEGGVFDGVDVCLMAHPMPGTSIASTGFLAVSGVSIEFEGRSAHAAADAHNGANALNAAVLTYMAVHANRQQLRRDADPVIHGIITEGGVASNVIPDRACLRFGVRSSDDGYIPELVEMVSNCARGAALATGCKVSIESSRGLRSSIPNRVLEGVITDVWDFLDHPYQDPEEVARTPPGGSTDFADVTHVVPGIHPMIGVGEADVAMHSAEFAERTLGAEGDQAVLLGIKTLGLAALEVLCDEALRREVWEEFRRRKGGV